MIRALDPKLNPASAEIQSLKIQLSDKDKKIIALEVEHHLCCLKFCIFCFLPLIFHLFTQRECEQAKLREYEEKLIVTAWYNKVKSQY